jgi:hypothetical protein
VLLAGVALAAALHRVPALIRLAHGQLDAPTMSLADSDIDGVRFFVSAPELRAAAAAIPPDATYTVLVGNDPPPASDPESIRPVFQFWLMPRRYTRSLRRAQWVIAYHRPVSAIRVPHGEAITIGPDDVVLRAGR